MPHKFNQRAFSSLDTNSPLVRSYLKLVAIELALKDGDLTNWSLNHHIESMIASLGKPALTALAATLRSALSNLWCEKKGGGGAARVSAQIYPHIRYLRHISDFAGVTDASSDGDLQTLRDAVDDLESELKREGILS